MRVTRIEWREGKELLFLEHDYENRHTGNYEQNGKSKCNPWSNTIGKTNVLKEKFQKLHNSLQHEALRAKVWFIGKVPLHLDPHQTWKKEKSRRAVV